METTLLENVGREPLDGEVDLARAGVAAWGEALRTPAVREITQTIYRTLRTDMTVVLRKWRDAGHMDPDADLDAAARALFGAIPGYIVQRLILGDVDAKQYVTGNKL